MTPVPPHPPPDLGAQVSRALAEDIGGGDVTAALIPSGQQATARVATYETAVICGQPWFDAVFAQIDPAIAIRWHTLEAARVEKGTLLCTLHGPARSLLTGERTALNFLQLLSGTATTTHRYVEQVAGTGTHIVDTRKTVPGLRTAQKYAVRCGGGDNHRFGLYDGILIKENHIASAGGLDRAISSARALHLPVPLMAEAENIDEARIALQANVDLLLLDDFSLKDLHTAVALARSLRPSGTTTLVEYSGNTTLDRVREIAATGVDRISVGGLTKHLRAIDLSMRFVEEGS